MPASPSLVRTSGVAVVVALLAAVLARTATAAAGLPVDVGTVAAVVGLLGGGMVAFGVLTRPRERWRTVDIVVAAVVAVASGVLFWAWNKLYVGLSPAFAAFPPGEAVVYGMWFLPAALVPMIVRKPGAAVFAEVVAASLEFLLASEFGASVLVYGLVQGLCAEAVWAAARYRRWGLAPAMVAGAAAGAGAAVLDLVYYYPDWSGSWKLGYLVLVVLSGAAVTGGLSWWLVRALAPTGALSAFPAARRRELV